MRETVASPEPRRLSHNLLKSLHGFAELVSLEELNLNFNQLASLDGLDRCVKICRLYVSNNRLAKAEGLCGLPLLRTACLFGNQLSGLDGTLETLRRCPKLREVDLLGNPLAHERGYKHRVVRCLVRLEALDGDPVMPFDKEMSREFFASERAGGGDDGKKTRPSTAPAPEKRPPLTNKNEAFDWACLPKEKPRLFGAQADDKLHADPVALGYLAKHVLDHPMQGPAYRDGDWRADDARKFVERLRLRSATHKDSLVTGGPAAKGCADVDGATRVASAVDASDPYLTIRRLIALVESLQSDATRAPAAPAADVADISRELERLRVENANMFLIREENASLRKRVGEKDADAGELRRLRSENADLAARLGEAEAQLQALHLAAITGSGAAAPAPRPRTAAEIIDECAGEIDDELEGLFRANAASLSQLRSDVEAFQFEVGVEPNVGPPAAAPVAPIALEKPVTPPPGQTDREPDVDTPAHVRGRPLWSSPGGDADSAAAVAAAPLPPSPARPGSRAGRALKARAAAPAPSRPKTPSVADILAGRRTREAASESDDDESADVWNAALDARKRAGAPAVSDRVVTTKHAWLLMGDDAADDGAEESKADVLTAL